MRGFTVDISTNNENETSIFRIEDDPLLVTLTVPDQEDSTLVSLPVSDQENLSSVSLFRRSEEDPTILFSPVRVAQFASTLLSPVYPTPPTNKRQRTRLVSKGKANTKTFRKMYDTFWTDSPVCQTKCIVG